MDADRLDEFARALPALASRRAVFAAALGAVFGGAALDAEAKRGRNKKRRRRQRRKDGKKYTFSRCRRHVRQRLCYRYADWAYPYCVEGGEHCCFKQSDYTTKAFRRCFRKEVE